MYIGILTTHYAIYAVGNTEDEVKNNIVQGYKNTYPPQERTFTNPTYNDLIEWFGGGIYAIDPQKGYTHE